MSDSSYSVHRTSNPVPLEANWTEACWRDAETLTVGHFRSEGSTHHPRTALKMLHDEEHLYGIFHVQDRYVLSRHTQFQDPVYEDSCVEVFLQPIEGKGYFNFEFNCAGVQRSSYVTDPGRAADGQLKGATPLPVPVRVRSTMPVQILPEIESPVAWELSFAIPFALLEEYVGPVVPAGGHAWQANFFKCANASSHPHWASWMSLTERNFHLPDCFGSVVFEE